MHQQKEVKQKGSRSVIHDAIDIEKKLPHLRQCLLRHGPVTHSYHIIKNKFEDKGNLRSLGWMSEVNNGPICPVFWSHTWSETSENIKATEFFQEYFMLRILNANIAWPPVFYIEVRQVATCTSTIHTATQTKSWRCVKKQNRKKKSYHSTSNSRAFK